MEIRYCGVFQYSIVNRIHNSTNIAPGIAVPVQAYAGGAQRATNAVNRIIVARTQSTASQVSENGEESSIASSMGIRPRLGLDLPARRLFLINPWSFNPSAGPVSGQDNTNWRC